MARSTLQERIVRLERSGVIAGYTVRLGPAATGRHVTAHVAITVDPKRGGHVQQTLRRIAGVRTLHTVSGLFDLIAVVAAETTAEIDSVLDRIGSIPGVDRTTSSIVLTTNSTADPLPCPFAVLDPDSHRVPFNLRQRVTESRP